MTVLRWATRRPVYTQTGTCACDEENRLRVAFFHDPAALLIILIQGSNSTINDLLIAVRRACFRRNALLLKTVPLGVAAVVFIFVDTFNAIMP